MTRRRLLAKQRVLDKLHDEDLHSEISTIDARNMDKVVDGQKIQDFREEF